MYGMTHPYWPLFDLEVRTPRLTMRAITDELAVELAALAARGIHDPAIMPFAMPWSRRESPDLERQALQFYWRCRAEVTPDHWNINLADPIDEFLNLALSYDDNAPPSLTGMPFKRRCRREPSTSVMRTSTTG